MRGTFRRLSAKVVFWLAVSMIVVQPARSDDSDERNWFQRDFGGVGLLQTPTARMAPLGWLAMKYGRVDPYEHYTFSAQPFEWAEAGFRYTEVRNRVVAASTTGQDFIDKGVDLKLRIADEGRFMPALAVGFQDLGGTGLFAGEYLVANKRWHDLDFSIGLGWGYLALGSNFSNPLGELADRFENRSDDGANPDGGGDFNFQEMFTGPVGVFGGVQYRTPIKGLFLQLEYDGNDYRNEPLGNTFERDSRVNAGLRYKPNETITLTAAWERGDTAMLGISVNLDLPGLTQGKSDSPEAAVGPAPDRSTRNWDAVAQDLKTNAGIDASRILIEDDVLLVEGEAIKYRAMPKAELRANRILHNVTQADVTEFRYRWISQGLYLREDVLPREPLPDTPYLDSDIPSFEEADYRHGVYSQDVPSEAVDRPEGRTVFERSPREFDWSLSPGYNQNIGGPDGYFYQIFARLSATWRTDSHGWLSGSVAVDIDNNFDELEYIAPSELPRVRTFIGSYIGSTDVGIYNLQYNRTARLGGDWFGLAYAGILELMYSGVGGEILYRPFNSPLAVGMDVNYVRQREFEQGFGLRDYSVVTGHVTAYVDTGIEDILAKVSVGRYLARDWGVTLDFSREFESGISIGAYATFTDAGDDFGEGSFDKGIYLRIPFDSFFTSHSRDHAQLTWQPLTRDGGARLARRQTLYSITGERDLGDYWDDFED